MPPLPQHETTRRQLSQEVATYVRELIISGRVRKGNFLRIESISKAMDISSTPVREGLLLLQLEGFVKLSPRRGFMVVGFSRQDVRDIFWAQATLAGELAARAAKVITEDECAEIKDLIAGPQGGHRRRWTSRATPALVTSSTAPSTWPPSRRGWRSCWAR